MKFLNLLCLVFLLQVSGVNAQKIYQSFDQYNTISEYNVEVPDELVKNATKRTGYEQSELTMYIYRHKNGYISIEDHDRVSVAIYNKQYKWVETHIYVWEGQEQYKNASETDFQKNFPKLKNAVLAKGYKIADDVISYNKITNTAGTWYEIAIANEKTAIVNDKFQFVRIKN